MRSVLFNKYIPREYIKEEGNGYKSVKPGTGCYQTDYPNKGLFHGWGVESESDEGGYDANSVALIEMPDGTVETVYPSHMKFEFPQK